MNVEEQHIHLVRHGHHPEGFRGGWSHHSLSDLGRTQSILLAERLLREGTKVDTLISSDLPQARETADILARALGVSVSSAEEWREVNNGLLAGMPEDQARTLYPGLYWSSLEMNQPYPGGESPAAFRSRIEAAFVSLCSRIGEGNAGPSVMVVTHGGPIRAVLSIVNGTEWSNKGPQPPVRETGISSMVSTGGMWHVSRQDDVQHLAGLEVCQLSTGVGSTEVTIRPLIVQDIEKFTAWRGGDDYKDDIVRKEIQEHLTGKRVLLVAETGGQLVGTVQFVPTHEDPDLADGKTTAYLQALEVREDCRRQGLGTRLTGTVERIGIEQGFRRLTLMVEPDNTPAISFYRRLGFKAFKDSSELWRGKPLALICMSKALA
jgi:probable phosphoglycerate mutase